MDQTEVFSRLQQLKPNGKFVEDMEILKILRVARDLLNRAPNTLGSFNSLSTILRNLLELSVAETVNWSVKILSAQVFWHILIRNSTPTKLTAEILPNLCEQSDMCSLLQLTDSLSISFSIDCENSIDKLSTVQLLCKDSQFFLLAQPLINGFLHHLELLNDTRLQRCLQLGEILLSQAVVEWLPKDPFPILNTLRAHIDLISTIEKWTDTDKFLRFWDPRMKLLIQTHWESIFSGTVEVTLELYRSWLKLKAKLSSDGMFTSELQNYFNSCLWFDKGHFNGIATVIEFLTVDQLCKVRNHLFPRISRGIANNCLAPGAAGCYKAALLKWSKTSNSTDTQYLADFLLECLVSNISETNRLTIKYLLGPTAKLMPNVFPLLIGNLSERYLSIKCDPNSIDEIWRCIDPSQLTCIESTSDSEFGEATGLPFLNDREKIFYSLITVHSVVEVQEIPENLLTEALHSRYIQSRMVAFKILCKKDQLTDEDCRQIVSFIRRNLSVDDAVFRKQLNSSLLIILKHLSSLMGSKKKKKSAEPSKITPLATDFLNQLYEMLMQNLFLGANYQRLWSCFTLIQTISVFPNLLNSLNLTSRANWSKELWILTDFILHSSPEIRQKAMAIVDTFSSYFLDWELRRNFLERAIKSGLEMCNSAKEMICEAGADVLSFIYSRRWLWPQYTTSIIYDFKKCQTSVDLREGTTKEHWSLFDWLIDHLKKCSEILRTDFGRGAKHQPTHGFLKLLSLILSQNENLSIDESRLEDIIQLCEELLEIIWKAVGSSETDINPSFEMMQKQLEKHADAFDKDENEVFIPHSLQYLLACCWLNIQAVFQDLCHVLLSVSRCLSKSCKNEELGQSIMQKIGDIYFGMLLRLRHTGALDACFADFCAFCKICVDSSIGDSHFIITNLTHKALSMIRISQKISITRRSIGLPMIFQAVLEAEQSRNKDTLLHHVISQLQSVAKEADFLLEFDDKTDLSSVRAINCLRSLVRSTILGNAMICYVPLKFELSLANLESPIWAVRNAAVLLFSALCGRMFGPRQNLVGTKEAAVPSEKLMSLVQFTSLYRLVWTQCCQVLTQCANGVNHSALDLRLYPVLTVLSRLFLSEEQNLLMSNILKIDLQNVSDSLNKIALFTPVYSVKKLISQCYWNLFGAEMQQPTITQLPRTFAQSNRSGVTALNTHLFSFYGSSQSILRLECNCRDPIQKHPESKCPWSNLLLCSRKGLSAKSLALPILTTVLLKKFRKDGLVESIRKMIHSWANCILSCSKEKMSENCRVAASQSLALCGITFIPEFSNDKILSSVGIELFFASLLLAKDEISEVRLPMALAFRNVECESNNSCDCHNFECLGRWAVSLWSNEKKFISELIKRLHVELKDLQLERQSESNLFSQKGFNIFRESWLDILFCYNCLKMIIAADSGVNCILPDLIPKDELAKLTEAAIALHQQIKLAGAQPSDSLSVTSLKLIILLEISNKMKKLEEIDICINRISKAIEQSLWTQIQNVVEC